METENCLKYSTSRVSENSYIMLMISTIVGQAETLIREPVLKDKGNAQTLCCFGNFDLIRIEKLDRLFDKDHFIDLQMLRKAEKIIDCQTAVFFNLENKNRPGLTSFDLQKNNGEPKPFTLVTFAKLNQNIVNKMGFIAIEKVWNFFDGEAEAESKSHPKTGSSGSATIRMGSMLSWHQFIFIIEGERPDSIIDQFKKVRQLKIKDLFQNFNDPEVNIFDVTQTIWACNFDYYNYCSGKDAMSSHWKNLPSIGTLKDNHLRAALTISALKLTQTEFNRFKDNLTEFLDVNPKELSASFGTADYKIDLNSDIEITQLLKGLNLLRDSIKHNCFSTQTTFTSMETLNPLVGSLKTKENKEYEESKQKLIAAISHPMDKLDNWSRFQLTNISRLVAHFHYHPFRSDCAKDLIGFITDINHFLEITLTQPNLKLSRIDFSKSIEKLNQLVDHAIRQRTQGTYPLFYESVFDLLTSQRGGVSQVLQAFSVLPRLTFKMIAKITKNPEMSNWNGLVVFGMEPKYKRYFLSHSQAERIPDLKNLIFRTQSFNVPYQMLFNVHKWGLTTHEYGHSCMEAFKLFLEDQKKKIRKICSIDSPGSASKASPKKLLDLIEDEKQTFIDEIFAHIFTLVVGYNNSLTLFINDYNSSFSHADNIDLDGCVYPVLIKIFDVVRNEFDSSPNKDFIDIYTEIANTYSRSGEISKLFTRYSRIPLPNNNNVDLTEYMPFIKFGNRIIEFIHYLFCIHSFFKDWIDKHQRPEFEQKLQDGIHQIRKGHPILLDITHDDDAEIAILIPFMTRCALLRDPDSLKDDSRYAEIEKSRLLSCNQAGMLTLWNIWQQII